MAKKKKKKQNVGAVVWGFLKGTLFGRLLLFLLGFALLIGLNILLSQNNFERFEFITGIEVVLAIIALAVGYLLREQQKA